MMQSIYCGQDKSKERWKLHRARILVDMDKCVFACPTDRASVCWVCARSRQLSNGFYVCADAPIGLAASQPLPTYN
jgi:hypothetical protein